MIKKIVCAAIMTALLVSQAVCVLADEPAATGRSVATKTTYADGQITVSTTVSGVEEKDEITYLAYTGKEVTDESIAYIDQKTVEATDNGQVTFDYVTDLKFNGSKVMVGGLDKSEAVAFAVDATGSIDAKMVVTIGESKYEIAPVTTNEGFTKIAANVEGTTLSDGTADVTWFAAADGIWFANSALNGKTTVALTWSGDAPEIAATPVLGAVKNIGAKLLVLATKAQGAAEYGIKVSKKAFDGLTVVDALGTYTVDEEEKAVTAADLDDKVVKYAALGTDAEGNYVVAIEGLLADNVEYTVAAYSDAADTTTKTIKNVVEVEEATE